MKEAIENKLGYWFVDGKKYSGMLSFSQEDGIYVTIISTEMSLGFNTLKKIPIVTGVIENGQPITLVRCQIYHSNMVMKNLSDELTTYAEKAIIRAEYMLEGMLFDAIDDIKFRSLLGKYSDLDEWVDSSGFDFERAENEDDDYDYVIKYKSPEPINYDINSEYSVGIGFSIQGPKQSMVQKEAQIRQSCNFRITSQKNPLKFTELMTHLRWFSLLLQIGSQRNTYPIEITGIIDKNDNVDLKQSIRVNIYFQPIEAIREVKPLIPPFFLFTYKDLNESIIKNWFNKYTNLKTIVNLRSTLFLHDRQFLENKFLDILQALETLHTMKFKGSCIEKSSFDDFRKKIVFCMPEEFKEIFAPKIGNLNYLSLQDRLNELLRNRKDLFSKAITNFDKLCKRIIRTRNLIVHASSSEKPLSTREMIYVIDLLKLLFDSYLLEMIGFSEEKINIMIQKKIDEYLHWGIVFNR